MTWFIITGTSQGLGYAIANRLLTNDNNFVIGFSRRQTIAEPNYRHHSIELTNLDEIPNALDTVLNFESTPEAIFLINNAATIEPIKSTDALTGREIRDHFYINAIVPMTIASSFIRKTKSLKIKKGIINISSGAARRPINGWSCYCSSKAALEMFSNCLNIEHAAEYVIDCYDPGAIDTDMQRKIRSKDVNAFLEVEKFRQLAEQGKLLTPREAAERFVVKYFGI